MENLLLTNYITFICMLMLFLHIGEANQPCPNLSIKSEENAYVSNFQFKINQEEDTRSYLVGVRFNDTVKNILVYGRRTVTNVTDKFWIMRETQKDIFGPIQFDFQVSFAKPISVAELSFNGKAVCNFQDKHGEATRSTGSEDAKSKSDSIIFLATLLPSMILGMLIILLIKFVKNLEKLTKQKWIETFSLVLSIDRSISPNNPNRKNVPLPNPPNGTKPENENHTYLDLSNYQLNDPNICKTYGILVDILQKLDSYNGEPFQIDPETYKSNKSKAVNQNEILREEESVNEEQLESVKIQEEELESSL